MTVDFLGHNLTYEELKQDSTHFHRIKGTRHNLTYEELKQKMGKRKKKKDEKS